MCLPFGLAFTAPLGCVLMFLAGSSDSCRDDDCCYAFPCFIPLSILAFNCGCLINSCFIPLCLLIGPFAFCGFTCGNRIYARYTLMLRVEEKQANQKKGKSLKNTNPFYDDYDYTTANKAAAQKLDSDDSDGSDDSY